MFTFASAFHPKVVKYPFLIIVFYLLFSILPVFHRRPTIPSPLQPRSFPPQPLHPFATTIILIFNFDLFTFSLTISLSEEKRAANGALQTHMKHAGTDMKHLRTGLKHAQTDMNHARTDTKHDASSLQSRSKPS